MSGRPDTGLSTLTIHRKCCGNFAILRCHPILAALRVVGVLSCAGYGWHKAVQLQQTAAVTTALRELLPLRTSHARSLPRVAALGWLGCLCPCATGFARLDLGGCA